MGSHFNHHASSTLTLFQTLHETCSCGARAKLPRLLRPPGQRIPPPPLPQSPQRWRHPFLLLLLPPLRRPLMVMQLPACHPPEQRRHRRYQRESHPEGVILHLIPRYPMAGSPHKAWRVGTRGWSPGHSSPGTEPLPRRRCCT